jgi:virulence-associated protein VagC
VGGILEEKPNEGRADLVGYVHRVYTQERRWKVADRAKLFRTGGSQAVRLPRKYRFEGQREVRIRREGGRVVLEPTNRTWSRRFLALAGSAAEFPYPPEPEMVEPGPRLD